MHTKLANFFIQNNFIFIAIFFFFISEIDIFITKREKNAFFPMKITLFQNEVY